MKLDDTIYTVIKEDGTIYKVDRNDKYYNHFQYLKDLSTLDDYFRICSFGLSFDSDNGQSHIYFMNELASSGSIVFENQRILSSSKVSAASFYLPLEVSIEAKESLKPFMDEIDTIGHVFLEAYDGEKLHSVYQSSDDLTCGNKLLQSYIDSHLSGVKGK